MMLMMSDEQKIRAAAEHVMSMRVGVIPSWNSPVVEEIWDDMVLLVQEQLNNLVKHPSNDDELRKLVFEALDQCCENGWHDTAGWTPSLVATDLSTYCPAVEGRPINELMPHIEAWQAKQFRKNYSSA